MQSGGFCHFALTAQKPLRGTAQRFLPIVKAGLERRFQTKVETYDLCFDGAHSFPTLFLLKHTAIPWKPDLVIVETGTLDGFAPELSQPAIHQIFHELAAARIPAVFLARSSKCSEENTRQTILDLGNIYKYPVADSNADTLPDGCHPSNVGHAQTARQSSPAQKRKLSFRRHSPR